VKNLFEEKSVTLVFIILFSNLWSTEKKSEEGVMMTLTVCVFLDNVSQSGSDCFFIRDASWLVLAARVYHVVDEDDHGTAPATLVVCRALSTKMIFLAAALLVAQVADLQFCLQNCLAEGFLLGRDAVIPGNELVELDFGVGVGVVVCVFDVSDFDLHVAFGIGREPSRGWHQLASLGVCRMRLLADEFEELSLFLVGKSRDDTLCGAPSLLLLVVCGWGFPFLG